MREDEQGLQRTGCLDHNGCNWDGADTVGTLTARNAGGGNGCRIKRTSKL